MHQGTHRRIILLAVVTALAGVVSPVWATADAASTAKPREWEEPQMVDSWVTSTRGLSCASREFCRAYGPGGNVFTYRHGRWSDATWAGPQGGGLFSLTCPAIDFCAATDSEGNWLVNDGTGWLPPVPIFQGARVFGLSCSSATFCAAVGVTSHGFASTWDGVSWSEPTTLDSVPIEVACASPVRCAVSYSGHDVSTFDGTTWGPLVEMPDAREFHSLSCPRNDFCVGVSQSFAAVFDGTSWVGPTRIVPDFSLVAVSCTKDRVCLALASSGRIVRYAEGSWTRSERAGYREFVDLDCPEPDYCIALKRRSQTLTYDGRTWTAGEHLITLKRGVKAISCAAPTTCMAVDDSGGAVRYVGGSWRRPVQVDGHHHLSGVSCPSSEVCFAVAWSGRTYRFDGVDWTAQPSVELRRKVVGLSCATETFCMAVDDAGHAASFDGASWTERGRLGQAGSPVISCATPEFCGGAVNNRFFRWDGVSWHNLGVHIAFGNAHDISCTADEFCAVVSSFWATAYQDGTWSTQQSGLSSSGGVSCVSTSFCLASDSTFQVATFDGDDWSTPVYIGPDPRQSITYSSRASCATEQSCTVISLDGWAIRSHG